MRRTSLFFGLVLALSLSVKLFASQGEPAPDERLFATTLRAFLHRQGFQTRSERRPLGMMVAGERGDCRLTVREADPHGTFAVVLARLAKPIGPLYYVYRGTVSPDPPKLLPLTEYFVGRELRRAHFALPRAPILAVAAAPGCDIEDLSWKDVATFAR